MTAVRRDSKHSEDIFFSPHFDDVVLSCGGLIALLRQQHKPVRVVTVFAGKTPSDHTAYSRHLSAKRGLHDVQQQRAQEDTNALKKLDVSIVEHWDYPEAAFRLGAQQQPLYACYDEIRGQLAPDDLQLTALFIDKIEGLYKSNQKNCIFYFPLALGAHIDHQLLFQVGVHLLTCGFLVRFYEEWPYAENYTAISLPGWHCQHVDIPIDSKIDAALNYGSQIPGLGGSPSAAARRLRKFAQQVGNGPAQERYWALRRDAAAANLSKNAVPVLPFQVKANHLTAQDFTRFLAIFRRPDLAEIMPSGTGICLDMGAQDGQQKTIIEDKGYHRIRLDKTPNSASIPDVQCDFRMLPFPAGQIAAVVAWQTREYAERPEQFIREAARVLEVGGTFCGSISFLTAGQDQPRQRISSSQVSDLLEKYGFNDIRVHPASCGFTVTLHARLRRLGLPASGTLALLMSAMLLVPSRMFNFYASWLAWRLGKGQGDKMRWIVTYAPEALEGYLLFEARKPAQVVRE